MDNYTIANFANNANKARVRKENERKQTLQFCMGIIGVLACILIAGFIEGL